MGKTFLVGKTIEAVERGSWSVPLTYCHGDGTWTVVAMIAMGCPREAGSGESVCDVVAQWVMLGFSSQMEM